MKPATTMKKFDPAILINELHYCAYRYAHFMEGRRGKNIPDDAVEQYMLTRQIGELQGKLEATQNLLNLLDVEYCDDDIGDYMRLGKAHSQLGIFDYWLIDNETPAHTA